MKGSRLERMRKMERSRKGREEWGRKGANLGAQKGNLVLGTDCGKGK